MRALPFLLFSLFLATAAGAAVADLDVRVVAPKRAGLGARVAWTTIVRNNGPDAVEAQIQASNTPFFTATCSWTQKLEAGQEFSMRCATQARRENDGRLWLSGNAKARTATDPDPANNGKVEFVEVVSSPDLVLELSGLLIARRSRAVPYIVSIANHNSTAAPASVVTIDLDPRLKLVSAAPSCVHDHENSQLICSIASVPSGTSSFRIETLGPAEGTGERLVTRARLRSEDPGEVVENGNEGEAVTATYQTLFVTNTADSGAGSLRETIERANGLCAGSDPPPCEIAFAIDQPQASWQTIRPLSALPSIVAENVLIDGASQESVRGMTNPDGPQIEISGTALGQGDGLVVDASCGADIRGLAINGFPGAGLSLRVSRPCRSLSFLLARQVRQNYLGTDATGMSAIPNERGLVVEGGAPWTIEDNVLSGNRRTGIFMAGGAHSRIRRNRVGFRAKQDLPLGNGGSGVFLAPAALGTDLDDNYVTYNRETGIAVAAEYVRIGFNSIHANGLLGIDIGLDGPGGGVAEPPRITSAIYDPETRLTTIEGVGTRVGSFGPDEVDLYANDACDRTGRGEGQYTLGRALSLDFRAATFRFAYPGDLTGKFISGTSTVRTCIDCFAASSAIDATGVNFNIFTRTTEFGPCVAVLRR